MDFISEINLTEYYDAIGSLESPNSAKKALSKGVFHYTSTEVLNAILENACFRASHLFYLNDSIEYKLGLRALQKVFQEDELIKTYLSELVLYDGQQQAGIFSISFSDEPDVLQQWTTYAKEAGVCIELDKEVIFQSSNPTFFLEMRNEEGGSYHVGAACFRKLIYSSGNAEDIGMLTADKIKFAFAKAIKRTRKGYEDIVESQKEVIDGIWESEKTLALQFLQLLASYFKEIRFQGEAEVRAAFLPAEIMGSPVEVKYFRQKTGVLRPYINIFFRRDYAKERGIRNVGDPIYAEECPIKSIMVGPGGKQDYVFNSVVHRIKYGKIKVWKYSDEQKKNILMDFVNGCFDDDEVAKMAVEIKDEIYNYIVQKWIDESKSKISVDKKPVHEEVRQRAMEIAKNYLKNNFLSSHGIWVKKSSLSYIF